MPTKSSPSELSLMTKFKTWLIPPEDTKKIYNRMEDLRQYIHTDAMNIKDVDTVAVNYVLRNQHAVLSHLVTDDPSIAVSPKVMLPYNSLDGIVEFSDTSEVLGNRLADMGKMGETLNGLFQDSMTLPIGWLKLNWQEDWEKDPIGGRHFDRMDQLLAQRQALKTRKKAGEFTDDSAEQEILDDIEDAILFERAKTLREDLISTPPIDPIIDDNGIAIQDPRLDQLEEIENGDVDIEDQIIPHYKGFTFDSVDPEDIRWDWNIRRPEFMMESNWMSHRAWMSRDQIISKFGLDSEQVRKLGGPEDIDDPETGNHRAQQTRTQDNTMVDIQRNNLMEVWEIWYKPNKTVYVWSEHYPDFLDKYQPEATSSRWFPFHQLTYNRVTGRVLGVSDLELQWPLQEEYNELRTHDREARNASYPRYIINSNLLDPKEKAKLEQALPFSVTELRNADKINDSFHELNPVKYDPNKYGIGIQRTRTDMEAMAGLPASALGNTNGGGLATEVAFAGQQMDVQLEKRRQIINKFMTDIFVSMLEIAYQAMTDEEIMALVGSNAFIPADYQHYLAMIDVKAGVDGPPDAKEMMSFLTQSINIAAGLGLVLNGPEIFKMLLDNSGLRLDPRKIIAPQAPSPVGPVGDDTEGDSAGTQASSGGQPAPSNLPGNAAQF